MKKLLIATILGLCLLVLLGDYVCDKGHPLSHLPLTTFFGKNYSIPVEEFLHKNTNAYVLPHFIPKVKLLFDSQIPYSAKYLTNPFLPVTKYDDKD